MKKYSAIQIMGILNITPDSFYDGGKYYKKEAAIRQGLRLVEEGADIIDLGGESSRPWAKPVCKKEELKRVIPVIEALRKKIKIPISIDTYKSEVADKALKAGANFINDISALRMDKKMVAVARKYDVPLILMHMQGTPRIMQKRPIYKDVVSEIYDFLKERIKFAQKYGIKDDKIIIDPGIGFGKTVKHNLLIIKHLNKFKALKKPILIGVSRKSFIGEVLNLTEKERLEGTLAAVCVSILRGANILRVHDVKAIKRAVEVVKAILHCA
ncbi:MAG: dihydropteroate synthase [Candidatus Aenigmatarchaeota archaeon]|nr:MAG: dihydropteroate synthase [Candidatus Aenigmarchaeota archaeon]